MRIEHRTKYLAGRLSSFLFVLATALAHDCNAVDIALPEIPVGKGVRIVSIDDVKINRSELDAALEERKNNGYLHASEKQAQQLQLLLTHAKKNKSLVKSYDVRVSMRDLTGTPFESLHYEGLVPESGIASDKKQWFSPSSEKTVMSTAITDQAPFTAHTVETARPSAEVGGGPWAMVSRIFSTRSGRIIQLMEWDFSLTGGGSTFVKEFLNEKVGLRAASIGAVRSQSGAAVTTLTWATEQKLYSLSIDSLATSDNDDYRLLKTLAKSIAE